jgi:hypothetical protein
MPMSYPEVTPEIQEAFTRNFKNQVPVGTLFETGLRAAKEYFPAAFLERVLPNTEEIEPEELWRLKQATSHLQTEADVLLSFLEEEGLIASVWGNVRFKRIA